MGYNIKQNADGSTSLVNSDDFTEVLSLDIDGNIDLTSATSVDIGAGNIEIGGTAITATAAEINYLDISSLGTSEASKAVVLDANEEFDWVVSNSSTDGGTSVEPFTLATTMTGAGGVGGRAKFSMTTEVALGGWANAFKGETDFGTAGSVTGLGSAIVAEMTLGPGTTSGTYGALEIELNMPSSASTGTASSLVYASVNGADASTFDTSGYVLNLAGITEGDSKLFNAHTLGNVNEVTHGLKVRVDGSDYYLLMATQANFVD